MKILSALEGHKSMSQAKRRCPGGVGGVGEEKGGDFVKKISLMSNYKLGESNDIYEKKLVCTFANQMPLL